MCGLDGDAVSHGAGLAGVVDIVGRCRERAGHAELCMSHSARDVARNARDERAAVVNPNVVARFPKHIGTVANGVVERGACGHRSLGGKGGERFGLRGLGVVLVFVAHFAGTACPQC